MSNNEQRMPKEKIKVIKLRHSKFVVRHSIFIQYICLVAPKGLYQEDDYLQRVV